MLAAIQPRRRVATLVVTAAAALVLGSASTAMAQAAGAEGQSTRARGADLLPDASWHGRPIRQPDRRLLQVGAVPAHVAAALVRQGAGYRHPGGSAVVRDVQRRLRALGYGCGPVDGMFGPRTRSAVGWFQVKHRLSPTGVVDGTTMGLLLFRTHGLPGAGAPRSVPAVPVPIRPDARLAAPRPEPAPAPSPDTGNDGPARIPAFALAFAAALALAFAALFALMLASPLARHPSARRRATRTRVSRVPARTPAATRGRPSSGAVAAQRSLPAPAGGRRPTSEVP